jgi:hypothetical protein
MARVATDATATFAGRVKFIDAARWYEAADAGGDLYLQAVDPETGKVYKRVEPLLRMEQFTKDLGAAGAALDDDDACRNSNITGIADATRLHWKNHSVADWVAHLGR